MAASPERVFGALLDPPRAPPPLTGNLEEAEIDRVAGVLRSVLTDSVGGEVVYGRDERSKTTPARWRLGFRARSIPENELRRLS